MKFAKIVSLLICALLMLSFTACTDDSGNPSKDIVLSDVLTDINERVCISSDDMRQISDKDALELYYSIAPDDVKQFAGETAKNSAEDITEIVLVEAVDTVAADRVFDALTLRYESQKNLCASYSPELLAVVNSCKVEQNGNFVALVLNSEFDSIIEVYNSYF